MTTGPLATVLCVVPENVPQLISEGTLSTRIDTICAGNTWMAACVAAIRDAPDWLQRQVGEHADGALIPNLVAESQGPQARAALLAQSASAAAAGAWKAGDAVACVGLARQAARWWSAVDRLPYRTPATAVSPLATLTDSLQAERSTHDPRAWGPVEDMVLAAADEPPGGRAATARAATPTWLPGPFGAMPARLLLEAVAGGQPGLWRAPQAGLSLADEPFLTALQHAWTWATTVAGFDPGTSVRWQLLSYDGGRASAGNGDAIGLACAVGLQQLAPRHRWLHQLDRQTSYLAAVSDDGMVRPPARVVSLAPRPSGTYLRRLVAAPEQATPPAPLMLCPAGSVKQAVMHGRRPVRIRRARAAAVVCVLALASTTVSITALRSGQSDARNSSAAAALARRAEAADLANAAQAALSTDPPRAIAAAAAAYKLAPDDPAVIDAVVAAASSDPRALHYLSPADAVKQLSLSSNGKLLAALLANRTIEVWNLAATPPGVLRIIKPPGAAAAIGFAGRGPALVVAGTAVSILNPITGAIRRLGTPSPGISALSTGPQNLTFATASPRGVRLWNSVTGTSHVLSAAPADVVSLGTDGRTVLAGGPAGRLRVLTADGGAAASTSLPAPVTSVLMAPSRTAYAVTAAGRLYCLTAKLRPLRGSIVVPGDAKLSVRPAVGQTDLTPEGPVTTRRPSQFVLTASNAALVFPDAPANITAGTGSGTGLSHLGIPIRGLGSADLATDGSGNLAATVMTDGEIRISTIDLASGPPIQVQDVSSAAVIDHSSLAITTGLLNALAFTALVNFRTGKVTALVRFSHAEDVLVRPVFSAHEVVDTGATTSSLDVWRIQGRHLVTQASNMTVAPVPVSGIAVDGSANLLFVAADTQLQVRQLTTPTRQLAQTSASGRINCLTADPARQTLYACTVNGVMAFPYTGRGQLGKPRIVDTAIAEGLAIDPGNEAMLLLPDGDVTLLPQGLRNDGKAGMTVSSGGSYTLSSALTSSAAVISSRSSDLLLYSMASGSQLSDTKPGGGDFVTALWPGSDGAISGATLDGFLFTLPTTSPWGAARYACSLLANPRAEWHADFGGTPAAGQLPADGGC